MSHRRSKKSHKKEKGTGEHRAVEMLTVGWLLTVLTALACEIGSLASSLAVSQFGAGDIVGMLGELLLVSAVIIGFISLIIAPVVLKSRKRPTPRVVIVVAICAGILPMVTMYWQLSHAQ